MTTTHPHSRSPGDALTPHTRGLRGVMPGASVPGWIIPAHAGFTPHRPILCVCGTDHPRTRGVYAFVCKHVERLGGSSPHTRGLLLVPPVPVEGDGIIPAHAGFTFTFGIENRLVRDHPRTRGVYVDNKSNKPEPVGSSPHTRGLR